MRIDGSAALITGGASGLGRATAELLAARGARVVVFDLPESTGRDIAAALGGTFVAGDVRDEEQVGSALDAAAASGPLRVLVNCAGIGGSMRVVGREGPMPLEHFRRVVDVNLVGTFNVMRLAAAKMAAAGPVDGERGVIVNTASIAAYEGQVGQTPYAASKAGIVGLTLAAARDLATLLIRVVTIAPGTFDTPLLGRLPDEIREGLAAAVPHPTRLGRPPEYAALVAHVVENPMLNGETIRLDGALRMPPR
jgi:NAD(P)-dependent dehydrogenase (short-subunit alcohol dehydrogenase family)